MNRLSFHRGHFALLVTAALFGSTFIFQRHSAAVVSATTFLAWRLPVSAAFLALFLILRRQPAWGHWLRDGIICGVLLYLGMYSQQWGLAHTTAGKSGFITSLYVILVPLFGLVAGERLHKHLLTAIVLVFAGICCLAGIQSDDKALSWNIGDSVTLASALIWAFYVVYTGIAVRRSDTLALTTAQMGVAALIAFPIAIVSDGLPALFDPAHLAYGGWDVLYAGIVSSGIAFFLQAWGQRTVPATPAAIILSLESVFALLAGWLWLDETVTPMMLTGCALLFAAMVIAQQPSEKPCTASP